MAIVAVIKPDAVAGCEIVMEPSPMVRASVVALLSAVRVGLVRTVPPL